MTGSSRSTQSKDKRKRSWLTQKKVTEIETWNGKYTKKILPIEMETKLLQIYFNDINYMKSQEKKITNKTIKNM